MKCLSKQGQLQPHFHSEARQLSTQLLNGLLGYLIGLSLIKLAQLITHCHPFCTTNSIYRSSMEQISRPQNQGILRVIMTIMLFSFPCSQSPGLSLPIFTLLYLLSRQKVTNVFAKIWRKICVRLLDLMPCLSSPTGQNLCLILSRNNSD